MHESIRWTRDRLLDSISFADCLRERRLACAQVAGKGDHQGRGTRATQLPAPFTELFLVERQPAPLREGRYDVAMSLHYRRT